MKEKLTKYILFLLLLIWVAPSINGQAVTKPDTYKIIRSNIGLGGSSKILYTSKGSYVVSQSIGQSSVIGTSSNSGYFLRQGYQQPTNRIKVTPVSSGNDLLANVFPNPFNQSVSVSFFQNIKSDISVEVFNLIGKLIYTKKFAPSKRIEIHFDDISSGTYLLKVLSDNKIFHSKLIKK